MSKREKLIERFLAQPKDFSYEELVQFLQFFGYTEDRSGKTSGSSVKFSCDKTFAPIRFHKPHPQKIVKKYVLSYIKETLEREGLL